MTENEMVEWHHGLYGHEFEHLGDGKGQGSLLCCSPWGRRSRTQWSNSTELKIGITVTEMGNFNTMDIIGSQTTGDKW